MKIYREPSTPEHLVKDLGDLGYSFVESPPADIYYPAGKGVSERLAEHLKKNNFTYYAQIPGTQYITAKDQLWVAIVLKIGWEKALTILPETMILRIERDRTRLSQLIADNKNIRLILKKNVQKRKGLHVIYGYEWQDLDARDDYIIAQLVLSTSRRFTNRPFHFRSYTILTLNNQKLALYLCPNAKILYGEPEGIITNNDIDLEAEMELPLFLSEVNKSLHGIDINEFLTDLAGKMLYVFDSIIHKISDHPVTDKEQYAQLFGTDLIITADNKLRIIECNSRPDMNGTSSKDIDFKKTVIRDLFDHFLTKKQDPYLNWQQVGEWELPPGAHFNNGRKINIHAYSYYKAAQELGLKHQWNSPVDSKTEKMLRIWNDEDELQINAAGTSINSTLSCFLSRQKNITNAILNKKQIPAPKQVTLPITIPTELISAIIPYPIVIKPLSLSGGKGISINIESEEELREAIAELKLYINKSNFTPEMLVEEMVSGDDHRFLVLDDAVIAIIKKIPPIVYGDGASTVKELIDAANKDIKRVKKKLGLIKIDNDLKHTLRKQELHLDSIVVKGQVIRLHMIANLNRGAITENVFDNVHPDFSIIAINAARALGLRIAGVDLLAVDISRNPEHQPHAVIEVNCFPGNRLHLFPGKGEAVNTPRIILQKIFKIK